MRCPSHLKVSPGNALQPTECVSSWQLPEGSQSPSLRRTNASGLGESKRLQLTTPSKHAGYADLLVPFRLARGLPCKVSMGTRLRMPYTHAIRGATVDEDHQDLFD